MRALSHPRRLRAFISLKVRRATAVFCKFREHPSVSFCLNRESLSSRGRIFVISFCFLFHENSNFCSSQMKMIRGAWDACQMLSSSNDSKLRHTGKKFMNCDMIEHPSRDGILLTVPGARLINGEARDKRVANDGPKQPNELNVNNLCSAMWFGEMCYCRCPMWMRWMA